MNQHMPVRPVPSILARSRLTQAAHGMLRRAFSIADIEATATAGILGHDERFELIGGELVPMRAKGARHEWVNYELNAHFQRTVPREFAVMVEATLRFDAHTFVEPDFVVVPRSKFPGPITALDVRLAVEVADTSLSYDTNRKIGICAAFGVPEVWVVNARTLDTHVFAVLGAVPYAERRIVPPTEMLTARGAPVAATLGPFGIPPLAGEAPGAADRTATSR